MRLSMFLTGLEVWNMNAVKASTCRDLPYYLNYIPKTPGHPNAAAVHGTGSPFYDRPGQEIHRLPA